MYLQAADPPLRHIAVLNLLALSTLSCALSNAHRESGEESEFGAAVPKGNSNNMATEHTRAPAWFLVWILEGVM